MALTGPGWGDRPKMRWNSSPMATLGRTTGKKISVRITADDFFKHEQVQECEAVADQDLQRGHDRGIGDRDAKGPSDLWIVPHALEIA